MTDMQDTKATARQEADNVVGTTREEIASVASTAQDQARNVLDEARSAMDEQSRTQRDRMVELTRSVSDDLEQMAQNGPDGTAADIARQAAGKIRSLGERMDGREPSEMLDDVRRFARRRPGTFLLGALAAGVVVGRLARGSKDASDTNDPGNVSARSASDLAVSTDPAAVGAPAPVTVPPLYTEEGPA